MICEVCGNEHDGSYGTGRFCSESCKQTFVGLSNNPCKCRYCGKEFKNGRALGGHVVCCSLNPNKKQTRDKIQATSSRNYNLRNPLEKHTLVCQACGCEFELEIRRQQFEDGNYRKTCSDSCAHKREHNEENRKLLSKRIKDIINDKGYCGVAVKPTPAKPITCVCEECGNEFQSWNKRCDFVEGVFSNRFCSDECRKVHMKKKLSKHATERCRKGEFGGKNNETYKKHKHGWYKGLYCGSSWELAFVLWKTHNGFLVKRSDKVLPYKYNGKTLYYYPDYEIDGVTYEIKGFEDFKAQAKHKAYPEIEYYNRDRMKPIIKEVKKLFGKNFVDLLEDHK